MKEKISVIIYHKLRDMKTNIEIALFDVEDICRYGRKITVMITKYMKKIKENRVSEQ